MARVDEPVPPESVAAEAELTEAAASQANLAVAPELIADSLGATRTPEAYFLDAGNKLVYHGRIDNSRDSTQVVSSELRDALDLTLAGKPVAKTEANAFGCSIKRG